MLTPTLEARLHSTYVFRSGQVIRSGSNPTCCHPYFPIHLDKRVRTVDRVCFLSNLAVTVQSPKHSYSAYFIADLVFPFPLQLLHLTSTWVAITVFQHLLCYCLPDLILV